MEHLYAPWRSDYLLKKIPSARGCFLCAKRREKKDKKNLILFRGKTCFVLLNLFPYNDGHLMIVPNRHKASPGELTAEEWREIHETCRASLSILEKVFRPEGFNVGMNLGRSAGAGVADHLHMHVVPRWIGDTNFMPVIGSTKVINQNLNAVFGKLAPSFRLI